MQDIPFLFWGGDLSLCRDTISLFLAPLSEHYIVYDGLYVCVIVAISIISYVLVNV